MTLQLTAEQVWQVIDKELFAVVGMVNANNEARTAGLVYIVRDRNLYLSTGRDTAKARHVAANPHVSVTIPIARRVPIMPWLKIPQATITFQGTAR
ncbi:MAG TPA: pyridoxamine 5'-phosphate oxidase family protein, partial [Promineifilum sp.]|nr:pyridoxamine 5'-phosphate oxidase family protein [Promineifilum sp.]